MNASSVHRIGLTKSLRHQFSLEELRLARNEIKSFMLFQATPKEFVVMIRSYLSVQHPMKSTDA
jgi:hypothetical protein